MQIEPKFFRFVFYEPDNYGEYPTGIKYFTEEQEAINYAISYLKKLEGEDMEEGNRLEVTDAQLTTVLSVYWDYQTDEAQITPHNGIGNPITIFKWDKEEKVII